MQNSDWTAPPGFRPINNDETFKLRYSFMYCFTAKVKPVIISLNVAHGLRNWPIDSNENGILYNKIPNVMIN